MPITRVCCNKELAGSCIHCCGNRYCTNPESVIYDWLDSSCSGYVNGEVYTVIPEYTEDLENGNN